MIQIQILVNDWSPAPLHAEALGSSPKILIVETIIIIRPPASTRPTIVCNNWWFFSLSLYRIDWTWRTRFTIPMISTNRPTVIKMIGFTWMSKYCLASRDSQDVAHCPGGATPHRLVLGQDKRAIMTSCLRCCHHQNGFAMKKPFLFFLVIIIGGFFLNGFIQTC